MFFGTFQFTQLSRLKIELLFSVYDLSKIQTTNQPNKQTFTQLMTNFSLNEPSTFPPTLRPGCVVAAPCRRADSVEPQLCPATVTEVGYQVAYLRYHHEPGGDAILVMSDFILYPAHVAPQALRCDDFEDQLWCPPPCVRDEPQNPPQDACTAKWAQKCGCGCGGSIAPGDDIVRWWLGGWAVQEHVLEPWNYQ